MTTPSAPRARRKKPTLSPSEKAFQKQVIDLARLSGWLVHHSAVGRMASGQYATPLDGDAGLPDLVLVRAPRVVFAELKSEKGRLTGNQPAWAAALSACPGVESYTWKPSQWDELVDVLRRR